MSDLLRDASWQGIGTIIAIVAFILTIFLEWPKVKTRLAESPRISGALRGAVYGAILATLCGALAGVVAALVVTRAYSVISSNTGIASETLAQSLSTLATNFAVLEAKEWAIWGAIFGAIFGAGGSIVTSSLREGIAGTILGMLIGFFLGTVIVMVLGTLASIVDVTLWVVFFYRLRNWRSSRRRSAWCNCRRNRQAACTPCLRKQSAISIT